MKKIILNILIFMLLFFQSMAHLYAQPMPGPGDDGDPLDPTPIGGGLFILTVFAGAYAALKIYHSSTKKSNRQDG